MAPPGRSGEPDPVSAQPVVVAEIERKFDVTEGFRLPDLSHLPGVAGVADPKRQDLDATYFDTADLRLLTHKLTLRRRTGGDDAGWHLKRPRTDGDRDEIRAPLGRATKTVPPALHAMVEVHARGATIGPVVRLVNARIVHRLLAADGAVLAEIAQDDVIASSPGPRGAADRTESWRELEVELVEGDRALLAALVERVVRAGAVPSPSPSKLSRAVEALFPQPVADGGATSSGAAAVRPKSAGGVLLAHLAEQVRRLTVQDPRVRADEDDAVHQMRVASRRLRSALATYRPLLRREVTDPLRGELQWLGGALGGARDAEVTRDHLTSLVRAQPEELVLGPVLERITGTLAARYRAAHDEVLADLGTRRYFDLLDALDRLVAEPPFTEAAAGRADDVLLPLVAKSWKRTKKLVEAAHAQTDPARQDPLLHDVRKAAKQARYAGESLLATHPEPARIWSARMAAIQEVLGEHQDSVVVRQQLLALAVAAHEHGENAFTYGRLHALEQNRAADTELQFELVWQQARDPEIHTWLP